LSGQITGIDIAEKRLTLNPRIKLFQGSQDDPIFLSKVCSERGPFDIIIDDGSHFPKHVATSFHLLFPSLANDGIYLIEDVQTAFWPQFGGSILHGAETMKLARTLIECLNQAELAAMDKLHSFPPFAKQIKAFHAFHNVFVIYKGDNSKPSTLGYDLNNPHAVNAVEIIERELEKTPTAEGLANLVDLYLMGGNPAKATAAADKARSLWPENVSVLRAAYNVAVARNDFAARIDCLEHLLQAEPDNPSLHRVMEDIRAEQNRLASGPNI
jgi:tetratricopeptide (TPR) repeat protein